MKLIKMEIELQFTEPLLGTASNNPEVHEEFIASKAPHYLATKEEEMQALPPIELFEKSMTVFPRDEHGLFLWDYQIRGFFKEAIGVLIELGEITELSKWVYKRAVNSLLFVMPRRAHFLGPDGPIMTASEHLQRPVRAETMRGERIALATAEVLPAGTRLRFTVELLTGSNKKSTLTTLTADDLSNALDYGALKGFGQWRSGSYGRFTWTEIQTTEKTA